MKLSTAVTSAPPLCLGRLQDPVCPWHSGEGSVILCPPLPKAAFPTYSPRNPHFLIFMDVKSKEILWRGPSVLSQAGAVGMGGSPAASPHVCSPPSCAL